MLGEWEWAARAACLGLTDLMVMPEVGSPDRRADMERARTLCRHCPVRQPCLDWVLGCAPDPTPTMLTGGLTPEERKVARREIRLSYALRDGTCG